LCPIIGQIFLLPAGFVHRVRNRSEHPEKTAHFAAKMDAWAANITALSANITARPFS
jgi:hypothetical protein